MKIFITGIKGFLGANLTARLWERGHEVGGLDLNPPETAAWHALIGAGPDFALFDADVSRHAEVSRAIEAFQPEVVVHLAAVSTVQVADQEPMRTWRTNVMGTAVVLEICRQKDVPVVVASSDKAYGRGHPVPFDESQTPLRPRFPYDVSKACQDLMAHAYHESYGLPVVVTRACNFYGPADLHWNRLVPRTFRCAHRGENPVLYEGMGDVRREWIYISDAVNAYELLATYLVERPTEVEGKAFNIGTGEQVTVRDMITYLLDAAGRPDLVPRIEAAGFPELGDEVLDSSRLRDLGWSPTVPLGDGLVETWEWYKAHFGKEGM